MDFAVAAFRIEIAGEAALQQVEIEVLISHEGRARTAASLGSPRGGLYTSDSLAVGVPRLSLVQTGAAQNPESV